MRYDVVAHDARLTSQQEVQVHSSQGQGTCSFTGLLPVSTRLHPASSFSTHLHHDLHPSPPVSSWPSSTISTTMEGLFWTERTHLAKLNCAHGNSLYGEFN